MDDADPASGASKVPTSMLEGKSSSGRLLFRGDGFDAVLGQSNLLPLVKLFDPQGLRGFDELLDRNDAPDAFDEVKSIANEVEVTLAVFGQLRLLGKDMHGFTKPGGDGFAVLDMLAKRFAKAQDRIDLTMILPVA